MRYIHRVYKINKDIEEMDLEVLLMNTLTIKADKMQEVTESFLQEDSYTTIFCFTETKFDNLDFKPLGLEIFSKRRRKGDKKGGGLMIGYKKDKNVNMEEIKVNNSDILALEGKI